MAPLKKTTRSKRPSKNPKKTFYQRNKTIIRSGVIFLAALGTAGAAKHFSGSKKTSVETQYIVPEVKNTYASSLNEEFSKMPQEKRKAFYHAIIKMGVEDGSPVEEVKRDILEMFLDGLDNKNKRIFTGIINSYGKKDLFTFF